VMSTLPDSAVTAAAPVAPRSIRVLFCCNPGYYQHLAVALASLLQNNQRRPLDVTVVVSARDVEAERKLLSVLPAHPDAKVTIRQFGLEKFHALHTSGHITTETYLRILALDTLPPDCGKIIYLDCDLVVVSALDDLWEIDLSGYALAAVPDPYADDRPKALGMPDSASYVNAGVLLINVKHWREQDLAVRVIAYAEQLGSRLHYHDQDAMNAVLHEQILTLPFRWNCQARMFRASSSFTGPNRTAIRAATDDPAIIHYTTAQKPWMFTAFMPKRALYRYYLAMTAWRDAPPTRRSLVYFPEALFNGVAYVLGSSLTFDQFLRTLPTARGSGR
jgi:lipopolysaccharide biosynthesis glycosyltransferase